MNGNEPPKSVTRDVLEDLLFAIPMSILCLRALVFPIEHSVFATRVAGIVYLLVSVNAWMHALPSEKWPARWGLMARIAGVFVIAWWVWAMATSFAATQNRAMQRGLLGLLLAQIPSTLYMVYKGIRSLRRPSSSRNDRGQLDQ